MFRIFPAQADDLLDVKSLPPTTNTELNYRTRPLTALQENRLAILLLFCPIPIGLLLAIPFWIFISTFEWLDRTASIVSVIVAAWVMFRWLTQAFKRWEFVFCVAYSIASLLAVVWELALRMDVWVWRIGLVAAWVLSGLIARQIAAWILAGPAVAYEQGKRWEVNLPNLFGIKYSFDCPELLTNGLSPILIGPAWWVSVWSSDQLYSVYWLWPVFLPFSYMALWTVSHLVLIPLVPFPNPFRTIRSTWNAIVVFLSYDIYNTPAAGVFRFPTKWLRNPGCRWMLSTAVMLLIAFGFASGFPHPATAVQTGSSPWNQLAVNFVLVSLSGPIVLCSTLWFTSGALLARFENELSRHQDDSSTDWDNYVDRIVNSEVKLEREHFLFGITEKGDYPVLVHREIFDQHVHVLGDSGASKTALNIAPQATQLIARADSSVVIVDLKGDYALFQSCHREAKRAGMRFRWMSNEVGKTTFGFNPFLQSHNRQLSVEQLTQQMLQGLSLDYGIQYGAGYYTAMNEIVLKNVLKETGDRSFYELSKHLSDRDWYGQIGDKDDWRQARHLAALVNRLGASTPINVVPETFYDRPEILENSIDAADVMDNPQVVYLFLRSPIEPTNAPTIARLFLWSMFNAATQRPQDSNRVYFFIDEVQQIVSDGIKLIFEQFRDLGGTIIAAHQTGGQLRRQGSDLGDTIDSCTAVKQTFRASDLRSVETLEKLSGTRPEILSTWYQTYERGFGDLTDRFDPIHAADGQVRLSENETPRLSQKEILEIGSRRQSSLLRFTFGSGYTQFAGATVPVVSQFHISFDEYVRRRRLPWPTHPGAFEIQAPKKVTTDSPQVAPNTNSDSSDEIKGFAKVFDKRARKALEQTTN